MVRHYNIARPDYIPFPFIYRYSYEYYSYLVYRGRPGMAYKAAFSRTNDNLAGFSDRGHNNELYRIISFCP
jgi:hypothetical protein